MRAGNNFAYLSLLSSSRSLESLTLSESESRRSDPSTHTSHLYAIADV